ncbi:MULTISPECIES: HAD family hydrolase [Fusobacterium]|jgi:Cof subfamily protein (haloacid dehalogenase superfamily)|uniref:HAD family hydrolase n=1 Tax=Fusobacterium hominis TaxID=2764326 RepID=A0A7G9GWW2_9FUSO|nr:MULTISPECIES: HAD family hydrolase [Fusobacterium]QNM15294.1 HAD family hydrolase [Fusobacterium hominis]
MKFVVSDLDGTLLQPDHKVSDYSIDIIKKLVDKNINFVIATGRGKQGVQDILNQLNLDIYLICNNGANIYDKKGKLIFEETIEPEISSKILKEIKNTGLFYSAFRENIFYHDKDDKEDYFTRELFTEVVMNNLDNCPQLNKIIVTDDDPKVISKINNILREKFNSLVEITISQPTCLDISPKGCSKGTGIKHLAKIFNTTTEDFMAFGDGENDLDMLRTVGHPVIMANSQEVIKNQFSVMTSTNIEDGVAKYLIQYFNL